MTEIVDRLDQIEQIRTRFRAIREEVIDLLLAGPLDYVESQALCCLKDDVAFFADELERGFVQTQHNVDEPAQDVDNDEVRRRWEMVTDPIGTAVLMRDPSARKPPPVFVQSAELGLPIA